jgi:hypothetical protein
MWPFRLLYFSEISEPARSGSGFSLKSSPHLGIYPLGKSWSHLPGLEVAKTPGNTSFAHCTIKTSFIISNSQLALLHMLLYLIASFLNPAILWTSELLKFSAPEYRREDKWERFGSVLVSEIRGQDVRSLLKHPMCSEGPDTLGPRGFVQWWTALRQRPFSGSPWKSSA